MIRYKPIFLLLILVLTISMLSSNNQIILADAADGDNWLIGWAYREKMNFWEEAGAGTGYAVWITVNYASGADAARLVYTDGNCRTDFGDIRFTDYTGNVELEYWMQEKVDSDWARFWFKMTDDLGVYGRAYIYYGNAGVSYDGDGDGVFIFFDDFEDGTLDEWDSNNNFEIKTDRKYGSYSVGVDTTSAGAQLKWDSPTTNTPIAFHFSMNSQNVLRGGVVIPYTVQDESEYAGYVRGGYESGTSKFYYYDGTFRAWTATNDDITSDNWFEFEIWVDFDNSDPDMKGWHGSSFPLNYDGEEDWHEPDDTDPESIQMEWFRIATQGSYEAWYDNIFIRNVLYSGGEPYVYTIDPEEQAAPENTGFSVTNYNDGDNMYAQYSTYLITHNSTHQAGVGFLELTALYLVTGADSIIWTISYTVDTDTFSEEDANQDYIELIAGESSGTINGESLDVTYAFRIEWAHADYTDYDFRTYCEDSWTESDADHHSGENVDVETRLAFSGYGLFDGSGTEDRGDYDTIGGIQALGSIIYYLSPSAIPLASEIDVWITCTTTPDTDWEAVNYNPASSPDFSVAVDSDDVVTGVVTTYNFNAVKQGEGSGGDDLGVWQHFDTYIADHMIFIASVSETWVMIEETITVTLSAKYAYPDGNSDVPSPVWSNVDSGEVSYDTTGLREWYIVSHGDTHGITSITNTSASCLWDNILMSSGPAYKWVQYSPNEVWLIIDTAKFTWYGNSSNAVGVLIQSLINGTDDDWGIISSEGYIGDLILGGNPTNNAFDMNWHYAQISLEVKITGHDRIIWTRILTVDILHSINIVDSGMDVQDDWITFWFHTNWANASFTIWDNNTLVGHSGIESWYQIAKPTVVGLHNYTILINGTHGSISESGQTKDFSVSSGWAWRNYKFTVNPITFSITELLMMQNNETIIVSGFWHTPNTTLTWIAYEENVEIDSGILTLTASGEYNAIRWEKNEPTQFRNFTLSITADGSTINLHSYSYVLDSASYLTTVSGSSLVIYEGDSYFESTTYEGVEASDMTTVILGLIVFIFLVVIVVAIVTWRDGRNKAEQIYRSQIASGGYR